LEKQIFLTEGKVLSLSETSNPAYMVLEMVVCDSLSNLNGERLTKECLEANAETLIDMPIQVDRFRLEKGLYSSLTHRKEDDGLKTDSIGTITNVWLEHDEDSDITTMYASAKIWKRYPFTCDAIIELHENDNLKFSYELRGYEYYTEDGSDVRNWTSIIFMGHTIVSFPSYPIAKSQLLVAELTNVTENNKKEVDNLKDIIIAGMSVDTLRYKLNEQLTYTQWTWDFYVQEGKIIIRDWDKDEFYIADYTVDGDEVTVDLNNKKKGIQVFKTEDEVTESDLVLSELKEEEEKHNQAITEKDELIAELQVPKASEEKPEDIKESEVVAEESSKLVEFAEQITELTKQLNIQKELIAELEPFKTQAQLLAEEKAKAELEELKSELTIDAKSVVAEITEEMQTAIDNADDKALKVIIAEYLINSAKDKKEELVVAEKDEVIKQVPSDSEYLISDNEHIVQLY